MPGFVTMTPMIVAFAILARNGRNMREWSPERIMMYFGVCAALEAS